MRPELIPLNNYSMEKSKSIIYNVPTPLKTKFFTTSFPVAPTPITITLALAILFWSHPAGAVEHCTVVLNRETCGDRNKPLS